MEDLTDLNDYLEYLCSALGHADRRASLKDYCTGLMLPIARKSGHYGMDIQAEMHVPQRGAFGCGRDYGITSLYWELNH